MDERKSARLKAGPSLLNDQLLQKYRNLIEVAPHSIMVVEEARIIFFNDRLPEMLGYSPGEMLGMPLSWLFHKDDVERAMGLYTARADGKMRPKSIVRFVTKDGRTVWVESTGRRIEWEGRPAVLYFSDDVSDRKSLEEQFAQSQKMEAIGRLAGGIAHDFNNLLQVVLGYCSIMPSYAEDTSAFISDLRVIEDAGRRAASLTQQLLAFSRKQIFQPRVVDLGTLVLESRKMLSPILGEDFTLDVVVRPGNNCASVDAGHIEQVIMNLVINARDAMPGGGPIVVVVGDSGPDSDFVGVTVRDNGEGMDAETRAHIFEPFFTTKRQGKGTGLGLSIVYGIVRQSGGSIEVDSRPGEGSTFTISLPRAHEGASVHSSLPAGAPQPGTGSILLVEDEITVRTLARKILEMGGYTVTAVASGEEAVALVRSRREGFDLVLTDIVLTGMRGGEAVDQITRLFPGIPVVYMTGYADNADVPRQEGASILLKPFSLDDLLSYVKKAIQSRS